MSTSIPDSTLEKFTTFGDLLRYLRRAAGLTQLELSIQVGYSHAQISRLEQNLRLPDIPTIEARFVPALSLQDEPKVVTRLLELAANVRREDAPGSGSCPYKGLNYFDESDADLFVGREALTAKLTERVLSLISGESPSDSRFLAVVGASGSGKSSLVRAGLVPALRWNRKSADWHIHILTPSAQPLDSLARSLTNESSSVVVTATLMDDLARDPRSLQLFAKRKLQSGPQAKLLLVIDQFEELFALCRSEEERSALIGNLLTAASEAHGSVLVVITLRADFYAYCASYTGLREVLAKNQEYIGAMSDEELSRAIEEPARRGRWEFEPGLVDLLLHDVGHEPGALPLLSHALFETWQRRRGRLMTLGGYASSGGVRGAIAETAEAVFTDQFNDEQRSIARRIFLRLTELNDEGTAAETRRRATFNELILKPEEALSTHEVLRALADARLITTTEDAVEVAHEALIREWPTLRSWLDENRAGLRLHRQLTESAREWVETGYSSDVLYRGTRLMQTREWSSIHEDDLNPLEREFLAASTDATEREVIEREARRQRELEAAHKLAEAEKKHAEAERQRAEEQRSTAAQLRQRAVYLAGAFLIALLMALTALFLGAQARAASRLATSRELAAASITNLDVDPERSILLALEALDSSYTIEAEDALHRAVQTSRVQRVIPAHNPGAEMMVAFSPDGRQFVTAIANNSVKTWNTLTGKQILGFEGVYAAYSPDGTRLAVVIPNGTVQMIDAITGREMETPGQIDATLTVAFSPDGTQLVTVGSNNTPKIWDAETGKELEALQAHTDFISTAFFDPTGTRLLTASDDHTARIWETSTGQQLSSLSEHPDWVLNARYSPDGKWIATVSGSDAYLWDAYAGGKIRTLAGHKNSVYAIAFSPDSKYLATGGLDRKIILWDVNTGKTLFILLGHTGAVTGLSFSSDGRQLISSSTDGTVRMWDVQPSRELLTFSETHSTGQVAFSPDGTRLATTDDIGGLTIWDATSGNHLFRISNTGSEVKDIAFDPRQARIFIAAADGKLRVWNTTSRMEVATLSGHIGALNGIAVTADGMRLATVGDDYKARMWDISTDTIRQTPLSTLEFSGIVRSVAFNADGTRLAYGNQNGTVAIWDTATNKEIQILRGHGDFVTSISFGPDEKHIATSSWDGTAKIWDLQSGEEEFNLAGHTDAVTSIAYSPDGQRIATASQDGSAKLWDAATGDELLTFSGNGSGLDDVIFSPDGKLLATGGESGVHVYLLQINDLIALAKTRLTRSLTAEECHKYLHLEKSGCEPIHSIATTTPIPPTEGSRVCQITNTGGLYDQSFNEIIFKGVQEASSRYEWDAKVLQSASPPDFEENLHEFLRGDCDLIIGIIPMMDTFQAAAEANPAQKFLFTDFVHDPLMDNIWSQTYASDQAAFLAGYLAAAVTKTGKVGVFGGIDIGPVTDFMDGYVLGVRYYNQMNATHVEALGWDVQKHEGFFIGDFCCAADGREMTQQLLAQGADIIFPVAGTSVGAGALYAVKTHGNAYIIGVDTDWVLSNPEYKNIILTSVVKNYDVSVNQVVKTITENKFAGGLHVGTLATGEVSLAPFNQLDALTSPKIKAELAQIQKAIISGKIKTKP